VPVLALAVHGGAAGQHALKLEHAGESVVRTSQHRLCRPRLADTVNQVDVILARDGIKELRRRFTLDGEFGLPLVPFARRQVELGGANRVLRRPERKAPVIAQRVEIGRPGLPRGAPPR
jgi:hypothetical protein